jgi:hypothetical protein
VTIAVCMAVVQAESALGGGGDAVVSQREDGAAASHQAFGRLRQGPSDAKAHSSGRSPPRRVNIEFFKVYDRQI